MSSFLSTGYWESNRLASPSKVLSFERKRQIEVDLPSILLSLENVPSLDGPSSLSRKGQVEATTRQLMIDPSSLSRRVGRPLSSSTAVGPTRLPQFLTPKKSPTHPTRPDPSRPRRSSDGLGPFAFVFGSSFSLRFGRSCSLARGYGSAYRGRKGKRTAYSLRFAGSSRLRFGWV